MTIRNDGHFCFYEFKILLILAFFYILYSQKLGKYYLGACSNLERRLYEHNIGHSKFTSTGIPWALVYSEEFTDLKDAKARESKVKKMKSKKYIEHLIHVGRASRL
jgi:putative endonuclease